MLEAYPDRTIIRTFAVAETPTGHDRAALIDKFGGTPRETVGGREGSHPNPDISSQVAPRAHD